MTNLNDIFKSSQHLGVSMGLTKQMDGVSQIFKNLSTTNSMMSGLYKSLNQHSFLGTHVSAGVLNLQNRLAIPNSAIEAISSINRQHEQLFGNTRNLYESLNMHKTISSQMGNNISLFESINKHQSGFAQINNWEHAISGISKQIASIAAQKKDWTILEDFDNVTEQVIEFSNSISDKTEEEHQRQFQILLTIVVSFLNRYKTLGIASLRVMEIFLIIAGLHQYYDFLQHKPEYATKDELAKVNTKQDLIINYIREISDELKKVKEFRTTNRICKVLLKPRSKTIIAKLPMNFEVVVIQVQHKWVLVSYFDPNDSLPQTGWIMKKYLDNPE